MALFPITGRFEGDFVPHLVTVDEEDALAVVALKDTGIVPLYWVDVRWKRQGAP